MTNSGSKTQDHSRDSDLPDDVYLLTKQRLQSTCSLETPVKGTKISQTNSRIAASQGEMLNFKCLDEFLVPQEGLEPPTLSLRRTCSTS